MGQHKNPAGATQGRTERKVRRTVEDPSRQQSKPPGTISTSSTPRASIPSAPLNDRAPTNLIDTADRPLGSISAFSTPPEILPSVPDKLPIFKKPIDAVDRPASSISDSFTKRESFLVGPAEDRIVKDASIATSGPPSPISASSASSEKVRSAPIEGAARPSSNPWTVTLNRSDIDFTSLFPGPRFIAGTGKNPHIIDLKDQDIAYKRFFRRGGDDSKPQYSKAYWQWFNLQRANPPKCVVFDKEPEYVMELFYLIRDVRAVLELEPGGCSLGKTEITPKYLTDLEEEYDILTDRPFYYIVRFDSCEVKAYDEDETDDNEKDDKEDTDDGEDGGQNAEQEK